MSSVALKRAPSSLRKVDERLSCITGDVGPCVLRVILYLGFKGHFFFKLVSFKATDFMEMHYIIAGVEAKYNHWIGLDGYDVKDIYYYYYVEKQLY